MALNTSRLVHSALKLRTYVLALIAIGICTNANAQSPEETLEFDLPAQDLEQALKGFGVTADKQLLFATEIAEGRMTNGVSGEMAPMQALAMLLEGTGLAYETTSSDVILVKAADARQRGASDSKNLTQTSVLMAQNQASPTTTTSSRSEEGGPSVVTGKVTDARTGANLKGAKVTIEETGQWTSTNDLGEFRFGSAPIGDLTLVVSYLGHESQSRTLHLAGQPETQNFALRAESNVEEIVVFGQRSARAQALNQERAAENVSTVISSDALGSFPGTTIAEALRRAPGIAFIQDPATGDGANIIVRGLSPDFNTVKFNGIELPVGNGTGRSADLSNILADSIDKVTVSKTLLPSQDSSGIGGLVEIETKSPLDRPEKFMRILVERADRSGDFLNDVFASGTISRTFGTTRNFGVSASVQYRKRDITSLSYLADARFGEFLPLDPFGQTSTVATTLVDPRIPFPFEPGADGAFLYSMTGIYNSLETENWAGTVGAQWLIGDHTDLSLDFQRNIAERAEFNRRSSFESGISWSTPFPVAELDGEVRNAMSLGSFWYPSQGHSLTPKLKDESDVVTLRGETTFNRLELNYIVGHTDGSRSLPRFIQSTFFNFGAGVTPLESLMHPSAVDPMEGRILGAFGRRTDNSYPLPLLSDAGWALVNDPGQQNLSSISENGSKGSNDRTLIDFGAKYELGGERWKYIEAGVQFERSNFSSFQIDATTYFPLGSVSMSDIGLTLDDSDLSRIGRPGEGFGVPSLEAVVNLADQLAELSSGASPQLFASPFTLDSRLREAGTTEKEIAAYIQGRVDFGKLEVVGGLRFSTINIDATNLNSPVFIDTDGVVVPGFAEANTRLVQESATQDVLLPRFSANYRFSDSLILRGGAFRSIARPQIRQLSSSTSLTLDLRPIWGPNGDQPQLSIRKGNPDLQPAKTDSFDLSLEYYSGRVGALKAGLFYKRIENVLDTNQAQGFRLLDGITLPDDPNFQMLPDNLLVTGSRPKNSEFDARIWGIELSAEYQFTNLPGAWSGLGAFINYTFTDSERKEVYNWFSKPVFDNAGNLIGFEQEDILLDNIRFNQQPTESGALGVSYNAFGFDALLSYAAQSSYKGRYLYNDLFFNTAKNDSLDFRAEYLVDSKIGQYTVYLEALDILDDPEDPTATSFLGTDDGSYKATIGGSYLGGRTLLVGLTGSFD